MNTQTLIAASNGRKVPALTIFTYALQYFKEHALRELSDQSGTRFVNEDVRWVITVPAIWKQSAKQFMREAAYQVCIDEIFVLENSDDGFFSFIIFNRLELLHENFRNNYSLLWNPKQHRFIFENFECINLFLMIHRHFHAILFDVIMDYSLRLFPINHHRFFTIQKNVRSIDLI